MGRTRDSIPERESVQEQVTTAIRQAILDGTFPPGAFLVQEELSKRFNVSRIPVRAALRQLAIEGLISLEHHRRAVVNSMTIDDVKEIYLLRSVLEGLAAEQATDRLSPADIEHLTDLNELMEVAVRGGNTQRYVRLNSEFHKVIRQASGRRLNTMLETLWNGLPPHTPTILHPQLERSLAEHREMIEAAAARDAKRFREAMTRHVQRTLEELLAYMGGQRGQGGPGQP